jgi:phosphohistidine phosphatase SixA
MTIRAMLMLVLWLASAAPALAQPIFVVRHAERETEGAAKVDPDPDLSAAGRQRAEALSVVLKDAGVTAIYVTSLKRTQQTAAPLAKALGVTPVVLPANDTPGLLARLKSERGVALVVGHSNTVPEIVKGLGIDQAVTVADNEFDRLFVIVRQAGSPQLVALRYR